VPAGYLLVVKAIVGNEETVDERQKNFLTEAEIERFLKSSRYGRHGVRNFAMLLLAYRHGLRVSELVNMRVADADLDTRRLFVRRCKGSLSTSQPLDGDEIRALWAWLRQRANRGEREGTPRVNLLAAMPRFCEPGCNSRDGVLRRINCRGFHFLH
jgi:integrase